MFPLRRSALAVSRRAFRPSSSSAVVPRTFATTVKRSKDVSEQKPGNVPENMVPFNEVKSEADLIPPGVKEGTVPTDYYHSTGLERLEILGKMQGIDIFDMKPLDSSRHGTLQDPIMVKSAGDENYAGCTGSPADSHITTWLTVSRDRPIERCPECGSVYKMEYVGPTEDEHHDHGHDAHGHDHHAPVEEEPKTFADFVRPEYR